MLGKKLSNGLGKKSFAAALFFMATVGAMADASIAGAGAAGKEEVGIIIRSLLWVVAFMPLGIPLFLMSRTKEYLANKEEQGQYEPKIMKTGKIVAAGVAGLVFSFLIIGFFGAVFAGYSFGESWSIFVTDHWNGFIKGN